MPRRPPPRYNSVVGTGWSSSGAPRGDAYDERFARLEASGVDVHGEASFVERLLVDSGAPASGTGRGRILDAGCGTGRVAVELSRRGFDVVGVDLDPAMLDAARRKDPAGEWHLGDLADLDLREPGGGAQRSFDAAVLAGNVMIFLAPGTEARVLARIAAHLRPGGLVVAGFQLRPGGLSVAAHGSAAAAGGLEPVVVAASWDGAPFAAGGDYVVAVHRRPPG